MIRVEPLEKALPPEWRRVVRDQPILAVVTVFVAGVYLGKRHGPRLLSALVSVGVASAVSGARRLIGLPA